MDFDQIPTYGAGKPLTDTSWRGRLKRNRGWLLLLVTVIILADALAAVRIFAPEVFYGSPGGLDGCIVSNAGAPVQATVTMNGIARQTYADGCFFFPELNPGVGSLTVETSAGVVLTMGVEIVSGEAVELGIVSLP
jgi:hypothetical protein